MHRIDNALNTQPIPRVFKVLHLARAPHELQSPPESKTPSFRCIRHDVFPNHLLTA
jgi:hypothetical protein